MTSFQERIHGVVPALLTPLNADFTVDIGGTRGLVRRVVDSGCHGFVVLGTTGEFASIDDDQREILISTAIEEADGAVPVIVACGQPNVARTHNQLRQAAELGADGVLVNPPFYFDLTQDEVVRYFEGVVEASAIPVMLYNIPRMTKVATEPATLRRLRDVGVQGTKDSSGDARTLMAYIEAVRDDPAFRVVVGGDALFLHALISGACGFTGLTPNLSPQLDLAIYDAWRAGDLEAAGKAQNRCNAFLRAYLSQHEFAHATAKAVLSELGVMQPWVAPPKTTPGSGEAARVFEALRDFLPEYDRVVAAV